MWTSLVRLAPLLMPLAACSVSGLREPAPALEPPPAAPAADPVATPVPPAPEPGELPHAQPLAEGASLGTWSSPACAPRRYERVISFADDGSFTAEDRVSPCPPRATCIWSGIIHHKGTFHRSGDTLTLSGASASHGPGGQPFPTTLTVDPTTGVLAEVGDDGAPCPYARQRDRR